MTQNNTDFIPPAVALAAGQTTIGGLFRARANVQPDVIALQTADMTLTFAALNDRANRLANALGNIGLRHGDRVAFLAGNCPACVEVQLAAAKLGAITAMQNWRLAGPELEHCINLTSPKIIIVQEDMVDKLDGLQLADHQRIVLGSTYEAMLASADATEPTFIAEPEDGLVILYTSGTTGLPKGALISHRAMIARSAVFGSELGIRPDEAYVAWAPFFHMISTDTALSTLVRGGKVIIIDGFDADQIIDAVISDRIGWLALIPGMVEPMIDAIKARSDFAVKGVRYCGAMADLVSPHHIAEITTLLQAPFRNTFGATETGSSPASRGTIAIGDIPDRLSKHQNAGCEIRLVDADDNDVADGEPGELAIRGPTVFSGYWRADETNEHDFRGGWFHMGDVFRRNRDHTLDFVDRAKYMIKTGGENVYPAEIERVIFTDQRVADAAVVRVKDERWGEAPVAFVARNDPSLTEDILMDLCRSNLAGYKRPREIHFIAFDDFPRSTSGKIQRHSLEARLAD